MITGRRLGRRAGPPMQLCALLLAGLSVQAQAPAVTTRLDRPGAALYATISGSEKKIADSAQKAWVIGDGRNVVWSGKDGAGGYENEGQSLNLYNTQTSERRKLMAEYFVVEDVKEVKTSAGRPALVVEMSDSNLDASHLGVVDPARGEVFCEDGAKLAGVQGDKITLAYYGDDDWDALRDNQPDIKPQKTEQYDLRTLLDRPVMDNPRN